MATPSTNYVRYTDQVETKKPDEDRLADDITASMGRVRQRGGNSGVAEVAADHAATVEI
ncbi:MAG: hypothetical protein M3Y41_02935 [Pseudomonadota bacterium]|nr:hypothetical protein [Pseudomonadota bacterium]